MKWQWAVWVVCSFSALANGANVQTHTSPGNSSYMLNETATPRGLGRLFFAADYNILNDALVVLNPDRNRRLSTLVDSLMTWDLTAGAEVLPWLALYATLPLHSVHNVGQRREFALGDTRFFARLPLFPRHFSWQLSLVPEFRAPTGRSDYFVSDDSVGFGGLLVLENRFRYIWVVGNIGYRRAIGARFADLDFSQRLLGSFGLAVPIGDRWSVNGEFGGARVIPFNSVQNPSELYLGGRLKITEIASLHGGASIGTTGTVSSDNYRILLGLKIEPKVDVGSTGQSEVIMASAAPSSDVVGSAQAKSEPASQAVLGAHEIELGQEIRFAHDSDQLLQSSLPVLDDVAKLILNNEAEVKRLDIEGHCNELGSDGYNLNLSQRRAESVRRYLTSQGVDPQILEPIGFGKRRPKQGSQKLDRDLRLIVNRRVEFKVEQGKVPQVPSSG